LVVVRILQRYGITGLKLKWPNDVLYQNQKLAGVLIEISGDPAGYCQVVVGVGINVNMGADEGKEIAQPWIDLQRILAQQGLPSISRNQLVAALIDELVIVLHDYERIGFAAYCAEWQSFNMHAGQVVELSNGSLICSGVCAGISEGGALILDTERGRELFHGGEISLRRVYDS
jgi:BirA family transcriptional regulator, biotin operon repressor / biotin---[acetyl-CoA-carboxylase] ligase